MTNVVFRPLAAGETDLFTSLVDPKRETTRTGVAWLGRDYAATAHARHYRPEWTWIAVRGDHVVARAAWYGGPDDDEPFAMDWFDPGDDPDVGSELLRRAGFKKDYPLILPPGWRDDPATYAAANRRIEAAQRAGMRPFVERLHLTWTADRGLPAGRDRLRFERTTDVSDVVKATLTGTLDAYSRRDVAKLGVDGATQEALDILNWLPGTRDDWTTAYNTDGDLVGIVIPSRNYAHAAIAYVGVLPDHRGHGYASDLLAEGTRLLVRRGENEIHADTDVTNTPMAATFERAGYVVTQRRFVLTYE